MIDDVPIDVPAVRRSLFRTFCHLASPHNHVFIIDYIIFAKDIILPHAAGGFSAKKRVGAKLFSVQFIKQDIVPELFFILRNPGCPEQIVRVNIRISLSVVSVAVMLQASPA